MIPRIGMKGNKAGRVLNSTRSVLLRHALPLVAVREHTRDSRTKAPGHHSWVRNMNDSVGFGDEETTH